MVCTQLNISIQSISFTLVPFCPRIMGQERDSDDGRTECHCCTLPIINMKLACGGTLSFPPYRDAGVDVRIGTDGAASSGNGLNLLPELDLQVSFNVMIIGIQRSFSTEIFKMATKEVKIGSWDLDDIRMRPLVVPTTDTLRPHLQWWRMSRCVGEWAGTTKG